MAKGTLTRPRPSGREHPSRRKIASKPPAPGRNSKRATGGFFQKKSIEELAAEQGVSLRGQLDRIWGKGAQFWETDEEFERFVQDIYNRRRADLEVSKQ